jgi:hypothetical protein
MVDRQVWVKVEEGGADTERLQELTEGLRAELLELDVEDISGVREGEGPPGSRAVDMAAVGALLVSMKGSMQLLGHLVVAVRSWLARSSAERTIELTIGDKTLRMTNASSDQQDRLIEEFIHAVNWNRPV